MKQRFAYLAIELLLWLLAPVIFLGVYVMGFDNPPVVVLEHLYPVALLVCLAMLGRQLLHRLLPWRTPVLVINTVFFVSVQCVLIAYYGLVLLGLKSWGKVISEELIVSYARQARDLCESIGLSYPAVLAAAVLVWVVLAAGHFAFSKRFQPLPQPGSTSPKTLITILLLCSAPLPLYRLWSYVNLPHGASHEPFYQTHNSGKFPVNSHTPAIRYNDTFALQEQQAREQYRVLPQANRKNVILIVADALRADHMSVYGYARPTTPWLDGQVARGQLRRYDNVHSVCAESNCAMAGLLASRYIEQLPSNPFTLPQVLKQHGYKTVMILGGDQTNYYNKRSLFGKVDDYYDGSMASGFYMNDDHLVTDKTRQLSDWDGKPTMLQFHLMSTHLLGKRFAKYRIWAPSETFAGKTRGLPEARHTNFYDNGVLQYDDFVREILETLRAKKYLDNAIVIVTSDHGDGLGERSIFSHSRSVHEGVLHIPLLVSGLTAVAGAQEMQPFLSQADIAPTVLAELGMPLPATWVGTPLHLTLAAGKNKDLIGFKQLDYSGVLDGREPGRLWKYWLNNYSHEEFVYRLDQDPAELKNLLWQAPPELLDQWRKRVAGTLTK